jgi:hypothetical protein
LVEVHPTDQHSNSHVVCFVPLRPWHELAQALFNDPDESKADPGALALKVEKPLPCRIVDPASSAKPN